VANSISSPVAAMVISYFLAPYRPTLSLAKLTEFWTFLGWLSMAQFVAALSWQFDRILLGYFTNKSDLGRYAMASDLSVLPTQSLIGPAMQPVMAAFAMINDDPARLRNAYSKASRFTMVLAAPACVGMSLTSDLLVNVLLGSKWTEAGVYLQWLALATVLTAFYQPLHSLALATNRTSVVFRLGFVELCSKIVLMSLGFYFFSIFGVIVARGGGLRDWSSLESWSILRLDGRLRFNVAACTGGRTPRQGLRTRDCVRLRSGGLHRNDFPARNSI
jgi:PST family polysaccharide transporter